VTGKRLLIDLFQGEKNASGTLNARESIEK
jgi:hypothetical protein